MSTNRYPLVLDKDNQRIRELPSGDNLNLQGSSISAVQNIVPEGNGQYDLGADTNRWGDLYLSGNTIFLGNGEISFTAQDGFVFTSNGTPVSIGYDSSDFNADFSTKTTDDLTQGSTNKYYANSLVDSHLSGGTGIDYSNGVISIDSATQSEIAGKANDADISVVGKSGDYNDLLNKPDLSALEEVFSFANLAAFPATGETNKVYIAEDTGFVYRWSGSEYIQLTDQTAIWGQISGTLSNQTDLNNALNDKQATLVSGTNIKTINNQSILGSGNITIEGGNGGGIELTDLSVSVAAAGTSNLAYNNTTGVFTFTPPDLSGKQDNLVSGTNIKTINGETILGSGDIEIESGIQLTDLSGGTGVTYDQGEISIGQDVGTDADVEFNDLEVKGTGTFSSTGAMIIPVGTTAQRPDPAVAGMFRFNSTIGKFEGYDGVDWVDLQAPFDPEAFTGEGDLETQSGTVDLEEGTGTIDLMD